LPKPPVVKTEKLATAQAYGETIGKAKAESDWKKTQKGFEESLRKHLGHWIDTINPLELTATLGMTFIVKNVIDVTPEITDNLLKYGWAGAVGLTFGWIFEEYLKKKKKKPVEFPKVETLDQFEVFKWIISFSIAYIIVRHGGQIMMALGDIVKTLPQLVTFLAGGA